MIILFIGALVIMLYCFRYFLTTDETRDSYDLGIMLITVGTTAFAIWYIVTILIPHL